MSAAARKVKRSTKRSMEELTKQVDELSARLSQSEARVKMLAGKVVEDLGMMDAGVRNLWKHFWGYIEYLDGQESDAPMSFGVTEEKLLEYAQKVHERWIAEGVVEAKHSMEPGKGVCESCGLVAGSPKFFPNARETPKCPRCNGEHVYLKENDDDV